MILALSRFAETPTSSPIVAGLKSPDPLIRRLAEASRELAEIAQFKRDKDMIEFDASEAETQP